MKTRRMLLSLAVGLGIAIALLGILDARAAPPPNRLSPQNVAALNASIWISETLDTSGDVGIHNNIALDGNGNPHIIYWKGEIGGGPGEFRYVYWDGADWVRETVFSIDAYAYQAHNSLALAPTPPYTPYLSYHDSNNTGYGGATYYLRFAYRTGSGWVTETVDSRHDGGILGQDNALVLEATAPYTPHISYYDNKNGALKYAFKDGDSWRCTVVDDSSEYVGDSTSIALDGDGNPHISYRDGTNNFVKYAYKEGDSWFSEIVNYLGEYGYPSSLALAPTAPYTPYIVFNAEVGINNQDAFFAYLNGSGWVTETIDWEPANYGSLVLEATAPYTPHVAYCPISHGGGDVRYATRDSSGAWTKEIIEEKDGGYYDRYTSLALDKNGVPRISYYEGADQDLKFAYRGNLPVAPKMSLDKSVSPEAAQPGDTVTYTIAFNNTGTIAAPSVVITDKLSSHIINPNWSSSGVSLSPVNGQTYAWTVSDLQPGQGGVITITGVLTEPLAAGTLNNRVTMVVSGVFRIKDAPLTVLNAAPVADAGADQRVSFTQTVTLDGSGTFDGNGDDLTYGWAQSGGAPTMTLSSASVPTPTFTAPATKTVLTFLLTVTDTEAMTSTDEVEITVVEALGETCTATGGGDWSDPDTWSCGHAPGPYDNVIIPDGVTITLDQDIELGGNLDVQGTFNTNGRTVTLTGDLEQTLKGNPFLTFDNLVVNKDNRSDTVRIDGRLRVRNRLTIKKGRLRSASEYGHVEIQADGTLELLNDALVHGNWTNDGIFIAHTFTVTFATSPTLAAVQTVSGTSVTPFYRWVISPTSNVFLATTPTVTDTMENSGVLSQTQTVNNASVSFLEISGDKYQGVDITTSDDLGAVSVAVSGNHAMCWSSASRLAYRNRCIRITAENGNADASEITAYTTVAEDDVTSDTEDLWQYADLGFFVGWFGTGATCGAFPGAPCTAGSVTLEAGDNFFLIGDLAPVPQPALAKSVTPTLAAPGEAITYTVAFSNTGTFTATDVIITDTLAAHIVDASFTSGGVALTQVPDSHYAWTAPDLGPDEGGVITITGVLTTPLAADVYTNTVTLAFSGTTETADAPLTVQNVAPVADAGMDQNVSVSDTVTLDGSGTDANGDTLTYGWMQTGGNPTVTLDDPTAQSPTFTAPGTPTVLTFTLTVTDTHAVTDTDEVVVTVAQVYVLSVAKAGTGEGSVVAIVDSQTVLLPGKLDNLSQGTVVTLTATAAPTSTFIRWSGAVSGTTNPITVTIDADEAVTATFNANADLAVTQKPHTTMTGHEIVIVARNNGPQAAPGAVISDTFPAMLMDITWTCQAAGGATCAASGDGQVLNETLSSFPSGGVVTYTVVADSPSSTVAYNTVTITPPEGIFDPDMDNNRATEAVISYRLILPIIYRDVSS